MLRLKIHDQYPFQIPYRYFISSMTENAVLSTGILLISSYWGGKAANMLHLPRISGYLCVGIILGPSVSGILSTETVTGDLHVITEIALGIIAYSIGGSLEIRQIKHLGRRIGCITFFQAAGAAVVSTVMLLAALPFLSGGILTYPDNKELIFASALLLGAISAATAPGAVMAIISELKADGEFTSILLGVIALDDALTIILFAMASATAAQLISPATISIGSLLLEPILEITFSIITGIAGGLLLRFTSRRISSSSEVLMIVMGTILAVTGLARELHASALLSAMVLGVTAVNTSSAAPEYFNVTETIEDSIFGLFFALAGAYMDISILGRVWMMSLALLSFRIAGKHFGALTGAALCDAGEKIKKYFGLALFPQAGVTVGLILLSESLFPAYIYELLLNAVMGSVIINELIAPPLVKYALGKAGDRIRIP